MMNGKANLEQKIVIKAKEETEELIEIFVTIIKTAEKKKKQSF